MSYAFEYDGVVDGQITRPRWVKVIQGADGQEYRVLLYFNNVEERQNLTVAQIYQHLDNLVRYIKDIAQQISAIRQDDPLPSDGWHFNGNWGEVEWAKEECLQWWDTVYYLDEQDSEPTA